MPKSVLKQVAVEVTDVTGKIGPRWAEGMTEVSLYPQEDDRIRGTWKSDRPGDLDSDEKDLKRIYDFSTTKQSLSLRIYSEGKKKGKDLDAEGEPVTTVLTLNRFNIITPSGKSGKGEFPFRGVAGHYLPVKWRTSAVVTTTKREDAPPPDKVILGRRYRLRPGGPSFIKMTTQGFQEYEYYNDKNELLYVGKSGGNKGLKPNSWVDRLDQSHITTEWIGEAVRVKVTYDLTEQEALALEEVMAPLAKYNKNPGDHSSRFPQGNTSANAQSASKKPKENIVLEFLPAK